MKGIVKMERLIPIFLILFLLTLSACGVTTETIESDFSTQSDSETDNNSSERENAALQDSIPEPTPQPSSGTSPSEAFEPNKDLKVVTAFVYDNETYVLVENTGNQAVLNYSVAYINFDKNGFVATRDSDGYDGGRATTANIIPGDKHLAGWYGANGNYAMATVIKVEFADGTTWEATKPQIDSWAENASKEFSVDNQKAVIAELKEIGALAETNEYANLVDYSIKHDNQFATMHDLHFSIENTSDTGIKGLNVFVLEFDDNGFPVSVSPYDTYCINGHKTGGSVNLSSGQSGSYTDDLFLSPTTSQIKVAISFIEFQDESEWVNPYIYEWIIGNSSSY